MKKRYWILGASTAVVIFIAGIIICNNVKISGDDKEAGTADTSIGGEDDSNPAFLAGKQGGSGDMVEYKSITMGEAKAIFEEAGDYIILDVRRADEYAGGHIPGAIHVANEEIGAAEPAELPDVDQVIYVYCRSGRRSKEAAAKLAAMGYTNIIECGGILDWTGDIER